jgi:hypothetical protein
MPGLKRLDEFRKARKPLHQYKAHPMHIGAICVMVVLWVLWCTRVTHIEYSIDSSDGAHMGIDRGDQFGSFNASATMAKCLLACLRARMSRP